LRKWKRCWTTRVSLPGLALALIGLADNLTTLLALQRGAAETNPMVAPFTQSPTLFTVFTVAKCTILYLAGKSLNLRKTVDLAIFAVLFAVFLRATAINMLNWVGR
jgi:hypothetical protein